MKGKKEQKGITLVALIITIVVLLILAAVAIAVINNTGILSNAQSAAEETGNAQEKEQIAQAILTWYTEKIKDYKDVVEYLSTNAIFESVNYYAEKEIICKMSESQKSYLVNMENGEITLHDEKGIELDNDFIVIGLDDISEITAKYNHGYGTLEWVNSNEDVIKITTNGNTVKLEVVGTGNAIITAKVADKTAICEVMVPKINSSGTITNISAGTKKQLLKINKLIEDEELGTSWNEVVTIDITADIDMENAEWRPLYAKRLKINGNGNKISNLNCIQETENGRSGFIGYGGGATISNLTLENVTAIGTQAGAFIGYARDGATLTDCKLIGNNVISWQQNTGEYKEDYSGIGALIGLPFVSSSANVSATIEGNVTIKYNNMATYCLETDGTGALGFKVSSTESFDSYTIDTTNATITKEGTWTLKE